MKPISTSAEGIFVPDSTTNGACRTPRLGEAAPATMLCWTMRASMGLSLRAWRGAGEVGAGVARRAGRGVGEDARARVGLLRIWRGCRSAVLQIGEKPRLGVGRV